MINGKLNNYNRNSGEVTIGTAKTAMGESGYDVQGYDLKTIQVYNNSAHPFTSGVVEVSNDNVHWGTLIGIYGGTLAAGVMWNYVVENSYKYIKFGAAAGVGSLAKGQVWMTF